MFVHTFKRGIMSSVADAPPMGAATPVEGLEGSQEGAAPVSRPGKARGDLCKKKKTLKPVLCEAVKNEDALLGSAHPFFAPLQSWCLFPILLS